MLQDDKCVNVSNVAFTVGKHIYGHWQQKRRASFIAIPFSERSQLCKRCVWSTGCYITLVNKFMRDMSLCVFFMMHHLYWFISFIWGYESAKIHLKRFDVETVFTLKLLVHCTFSYKIDSDNSEQFLNIKKIVHHNYNKYYKLVHY